MLFFRSGRLMQPCQHVSHISQTKAKTQFQSFYGTYLTLFSKTMIKAGQTVRKPFQKLKMRPSATCFYEASGLIILAMKTLHIAQFPLGFTLKGRGSASR